MKLKRKRERRLCFDLGQLHKQGTPFAPMNRKRKFSDREPDELGSSLEDGIVKK